MSLNQEMTSFFFELALVFEIFLFFQKSAKTQIFTSVFSLCYNFDEAVSVYSSMSVQYSFIFDAIS